MCVEDRGGAEISMARLAQGLAERGHKITFAVYGRSTVSASALVKELGFTGAVIDFGTRRSLAVFVPLFRLLRNGSYDIVLSALTHTNLIAVATTRLASLVNRKPVRIFATEHGVDGVSCCDRSKIFAYAVRFLYARADAVIAVSGALAQLWRGYLPAQAIVKTIYNPVLTDAVPMPPAHHWLMQRDMPVIIGIGRLKDEKNFALLIRAFALLTRTRKARLIILGEGEQRPVLESLAQELGVSDNILMPGFAPAPQAWLAYADLFVCPSNREGFGNVIVEAMACGVPVVSTDCPVGPAEILAQGRYGKLVPVNTVPALAQAMGEALREVPDREALKARAQDFSVPRCIDGYEALIDNCAMPHAAVLLPMNFVPEKPSALFSRVACWLRSVFFYEHWMVGVIDQPITNALTWGEAPPIRWIAPFTKNYYLADPFPWPGSNDTLLCEVYNMDTQLGRISILGLNADSVAVSVDAKFPVPGHLSFPFLFMQSDTLFAMPESSAARRLEILRWDEEGAVWVHHAIVFDDLAVADAALYEKDGLFWISYTEILPDPHDNLHLIYATSLAGPWVPHAANPVQRGRGHSRNGGGVFEVNGKLYRPAQDCMRRYGGALRVMEITEWTTTAYSEREVTHITPTSAAYPDGFHSLVAWGDDKCLVDGLRLTFSARLVWGKLKRHLGTR